MADPSRGDVCSHDHDCGGEDCGSSSLHPFINHPRITAWNAQDDASATDGAVHIASNFQSVGEMRAKPPF